MQCKDIPDRPILEFLAEHTHEFKWATHGKGYSMPTVQDAMPADVPVKLQMAKMEMLIRRGLVDGCTCGCRGDYYITDLGRSALSASEGQ